MLVLSVSLLSLFQVQAIDGTNKPKTLLGFSLELSDLERSLLLALFNTPRRPEPIAQ